MEIAMRRVALAVLLLAAGCGPSAETRAQLQREHEAFTAKMAQYAEDERKSRAAAEAALTPEQRAQRDREAAKAAREAELLQRALSNSPDYTAAVRRAAAANVDADFPLMSSGKTRRSEPAQAREDRIAAEEARLSEAVEARRRTSIAQTNARNQALRDQQAAYTCQARGAQMEAAYNNPRSLLNLEGIAYGAQAQQACLDAYRQTGMTP
jgi:hypothetical protein